ncbi:hypothetical protein L9F63_008622, partial [Diploptera punctata]
MDETPTYSFTYMPTDEKSDMDCNLDYKNQKLLIPDSVQKENEELNPQLQGGPKEYLILKDNMVANSGGECNKAGVNYEAFSRQPNRCDKPRGSCLKNQPNELWRHDIEARLRGKKGQYFLENFGTVPDDPIKKNGQEEYISLEYSGEYTSVVEIEVKADDNNLVEVGTCGRITEVHVDATNPLTTHVYAIVTNTGLASSGFYVHLRDCFPDTPPGWNNDTWIYKKIAPQHIKEFCISLKGEMPSDIIACSVELMNEQREILAKRRIDIKKRRWCFCMWHCLCACVGGADGLQCHPMTTEEYHETGFVGSLPDESQSRFSTFTLIILFLLSLLLTLLLLGLIKGILGLCCFPYVGMWGLDSLVKLPRQIPHYYETELHDRIVIYDCGGYPVHPDTKLRTVRLIS